MQANGRLTNMHLAVHKIFRFCGLCYVFLKSCIICDLKKNLGFQIFQVSAVTYLRCAGLIICSKFHALLSVNEFCRRVNILLQKK